MPYFLVRLAALLSTQHIPAARPRSQRTLVSPGAGRGQGPLRSAVFRYGIWIWKTEFSSHAISRTTVLSHNPIWSPSCKSIWHTAREKRMNRSFHPMRISQWPKTVCAAVLPTTTGDAGGKKTSIHLFRHTFARKYLVDCGGNAFTLQKLLGHSMLDMTMHYCAIYDVDLVKNFDEFSSLSQLSTKRIKLPTGKR